MAPGLWMSPSARLDGWAPFPGCRTWPRGGSRVVIDMFVFLFFCFCVCVFAFSFCFCFGYSFMYLCIYVFMCLCVVFVYLFVHLLICLYVYSFVIYLLFICVIIGLLIYSCLVSSSGRVRLKAASSKKTWRFGAEPLWFGVEVWWVSIYPQEPGVHIFPG